jgi:hypothetical protein
VTALLPVWPLQCSDCRTAFTYPRASSLSDAYLEAHINGWAIALHADGRPDYLQCPRCAYRHPRRMENP